MAVYAPGKLILSGEHAVVYGQPALAMAVNRYAKANVTPDALPEILFDLSNLSHHSRLTLNDLGNLKERIKRHYQRFKQGEYHIREVLQQPFELAQVAFALLADIKNMAFSHGVNIQVLSDIPIGCGMGSSAATILCLMQAVLQYFNLSLTSDALYQLALEAEHLQHGHSSGLDLRVSLQGGCVYIKEQVVETRPLPQMSLYLINTGTPATTTGQCVEHVKAHFKSQALTNDFATVTQAMDQALQAQSCSAMQAAVRANHRLLHHIGVVPEKVQQFILAIEKMGAAAKICGAGAVAGDQAGMVLAVLDDDAALKTLCQHYGYTLTTISGELRGVHVN